MSIHARQDAKNPSQSLGKGLKDRGTDKIVFTQRSSLNGELITTSFMKSISKQYLKVNEKTKKHKKRKAGEPIKSFFTQRSSLCGEQKAFLTLLYQSQNPKSIKCKRKKQYQLNNVKNRKKEGSVHRLCRLSPRSSPIRANY